MGDAPREVKRRRVFYIPGYDPIHPRRYRELYRRKPRAGGDFRLRDRAETPAGRRTLWLACRGPDRGRRDRGRYRGSGLVRHRARLDGDGNPGTYAQLVRTAWTYIGSGALRRLMWLRKGPVIAALYPVGDAAFPARRRRAARLGRGRAGGAGASGWTGWIVALPVIWAVLSWFRRRTQALRLLPDARLRLFRPLEGREPARAGGADGRVHRYHRRRADRRRWTRCWWWAIPRARIWRSRSWPT
jgi:hypothetical protein